MDDTLWKAYSDIAKMMATFKAFLDRPIVPLEFLLQRSDGIVDVRLYHRMIGISPSCSPTGQIHLCSTIRGLSKQ
jgi:hypothetical protein